MEERNNMCYGVDMSKEEWRTKPEWKGYYEFSNWGRVRSLDRWVSNGKGKRFVEGQFLSTNVVGKDVIVQLRYNGRKHTHILAKIIAELFMPNYDDSKPIVFKDGNSNNCRLDNLENTIQLGDSYFHQYELSAPIVQLNNNVQDTPIIEGGFAVGQRILFDLQLADKIGKPLGQFRDENIMPNIDNMAKGIDYIDLTECNSINDYIDLLIKLGYTTHGLLRTQHIYIFSERGVAKVMSTLKNSNPAKWEFLNNFVNEYFNMREQIKNQVPQLTRKQQLQLQLFSDDEMEVVAAHKELLKLEVQEATAPLLDTIEKQAPKVDKFDRYMESDGTYNATNTAKLLNISSAQKFNNLLKDEKIQYRSGKNWVLYSKYQWLIDEGYCKYIEGENSNYSYIQLRWFPKGVDWLRTQLQEQVI